MVPLANPCSKQTLTLVNEDALVFKVVPGGSEKLKSELRANAMFNNSDVNRCPDKTLKLYDTDNKEITGNTAKLITIGDSGSSRGKLIISEEFFPEVFPPAPVTVRLGMTTGWEKSFEFLVYKEITIQRKTPCEVSRDMKRVVDGK